jgi:hypothetical protein
MPVNVALGHVSNAFLIAALVIYSLSVVAFAGDFAFGRPRRAAAAAHGQQAQDRAAALASVGAASAAGAAADQAPAPATVSAAPADDAGTMPELAVPALRAIREAGRWIVAAVRSPCSGRRRTPRPSSPAGWRSTARPGATCTSSSPP